MNKIEYTIHLSNGNTLQFTTKIMVSTKDSYTFFITDTITYKVERSHIQYMKMETIL